MKKLLILTILVASAVPFFASADCINNVDTVTGRACLTVNPSGPAVGTGVSSQTSGQQNGQLTYTPLEPLPGAPAQYGGANGFVQYVQSTYQTLVVLGSILAVVLLVIGGIRYMLSEATHGIESAKKQMNAALFGLAIVVGSFLILYTLNPNLLHFNLNLNPSTTQTIQPLPSTQGQSLSAADVQKIQASLNTTAQPTATGAIVTAVGDAKVFNPATDAQAIQQFNNDCASGSKSAAALSTLKNYNWVPILGPAFGAIGLAAQIYQPMSRGTVTPVSPDLASNAPAGSVVEACTYQYDVNPVPNGA